MLNLQMIIPPWQAICLERCPTLRIVGWPPVPRLATI